MRFYDAEGRFLRSVGREGDGPGEFRYLASIFVGEDSILAYEFLRTRVSVFKTTGEFVRSFRLEPAAEGRFNPTLVGVMADGALLVRMGRVFRAGEETSGVNRDSMALFRYSREGEPLEAIGRFPGRESYVRVDGSTMGVTSLAFGKATSIAVRDGRFLVGTADSYEIARYDTEGRLEALIRKRHDNLPVTREDIERYRQAQLDENDEGMMRQFMERMLAEMPLPQTMPAYSGVRVDAAGYLWVEEYRRPGDDLPRWNVFDPEGRLLGTVETPVGLAIREIGHDYLLGLWRDEFDVEHVRVHRLERSELGQVAALHDDRAGGAGGG